MQIARVIGAVVATIKDPSLDSITLLLVQPIGADGKDVGRPLVAVDSVGAGVGEQVFFSARQGSQLPVASARSSGRCRHRRHHRPLHGDQVILARVVGTVVSTQKRLQFEGAKLMLVQPETPQGEAKGAALLAIDSVGAGVSERVIVVLEGRAAGEALGKKLAPVDAAIVGIVDQLDCVE